LSLVIPSSKHQYLQQRLYTTKPFAAVNCDRWGSNSLLGGAVVKRPSSQHSLMTEADEAYELRANRD